MTEIKKPIVGFSIGDINGIGLEIIIKSLGDNRILDICTPIIFGNNKCINFYKKSLADTPFQYQIIKELSKIHTKSVNIYNCWEEEIQITPGQLNESGGQYARESLLAATNALKEGIIDILVTAPIHKSNIQHESFSFTGHTPFLKSYFEIDEVVMLMVAENMRVAVLSEHVPISEAAKYVTEANISKKLEIINNSLKRDFGIDRPKIAVLGLNPHAGDEGLVGREELDVIVPAIRNINNNKGILAFGPYSADAFFAKGHYQQFDAVLAMYHDQGLIPFKSLAIGEGVNYTAGMPVIRTSPDHGTAFDIAGQGVANHLSLLESVYLGIDVLQQRTRYADNHANPMVKRTHQKSINPVHEAEVNLPD